ncbi:GNAT family N-acetyltransferase [Rhodococcus sp. D2-41]|uniref:GNAT family N-acetyltransferase n=1 Tax=Speluncibacter jeojiensis TaxID=2710754 RepID=UPI00241069E0|nr:GNAT family N-acetyltransferase [Rhodococcus sp. D2-41]MDG3008766.1 GNAT family N-acetyltransferase [Rhodococcus sp. D2-41]
MIRRVQIEDVPAIVDLIYGLAEYEKLRHECTVTPEQIEAALFGPNPAVFGHVAVEATPDAAGEEVVGMALWFLSFSTWDGVHGIYLEDLYVRPDRRGGGHGTALLAALARECATHGYTRLGWEVLDWNEPSIGFYRSIGARSRDEWTNFRLTGAELAALAERAD